MCFTHKHTFHFMPKTVQWVNFIITTLWLKQSRSREVNLKQLAQDHAASKQRCLGSSPNFFSSGVFVLKPQTAPSPLLVGKDKSVTPGSQQSHARNHREKGLEAIVKIICSLSAQKPFYRREKQVIRRRSMLLRKVTRNPMIYPPYGMTLAAGH